MKSFAIFLPVLLLLSACGGGSSASSNTPTTTVFDLATAYDQLLGGSTFDLSGTDNRGSVFTGVVSYANRGATIFNGQPVTRVDSFVSLTNADTGVTASGTTSHYYLANWAPYATYGRSAAVTYTTESAVEPPARATIGEFGAAARFLGDDGSVRTGNWYLAADSSGNAMMRFNSTAFYQSRFVSQEFDGFLVTPAGDVLSAELILRDSQGWIVTLSGSKRP